MKKIISLILVFVLPLALFGCETEKPQQETPSFYDEFPTGEEIQTVEIEQNPTAALTLEDGSQVVIELHYYSAPNAVADFIALAHEGIYNTMAFNEVRNNCIVMTGSPEGEYKPPYYVMDETGESNKLSHTRGTVSMVRTSNADTLTGQFFILTKDQTHFDGRFTPFGRVVSGMENIEKIAASVNEDDTIAPVKITSVTVETYGVEFPNPTIIPVK